MWRLGSVERKNQGGGIGQVKGDGSMSKDLIWYSMGKLNCCVHDNDTKIEEMWLLMEGKKL